MLLKTVLTTALLAATFTLSGCSSDSKEAIEEDAKSLMADCLTGKKTEQECQEEGKKIEARIKALKN